MLEFTQPGKRDILKVAGSVSCRSCLKIITLRGCVCLCSNMIYYCSESCMRLHASACIVRFTNIVPRPTNVHKLAFYFPPERPEVLLCWTPCPAITNPPCDPSCNECIVCEGCHECGPQSDPVPDNLLAQGAGLTVNAIHDYIDNWDIVPGITDPADWTNTSIFGLTPSDLYDGCELNSSIDKLTGYWRDWRGPFVMYGNASVNCEGKAIIRDVTKEDLETARKFFLATTPRELADAEEVENERIENVPMEMNAMLGKALKRN